MPYTYKSIAWLWLVTFGLLALTGSGVVTGKWLLLLLPIALAAPALILSSPSSSQVGLTTTSRERAAIVSDQRDRSSLDLRKVDVDQWEDEGVARRMPFNGRVREPAHAARHWPSQASPSG